MISLRIVYKQSLKFKSLLFNSNIYSDINLNLADALILRTVTLIIKVNEAVTLKIFCNFMIQYYNI